MNDPAMVNDVMGYPEDYDLPVNCPAEHAINDFNIEDLDVGELQECEIPEASEYRHPDTSVPCTPPRNTPEPMQRRVSWADMNADLDIGTDTTGTHGNGDVALCAGEPSRSRGACEEHAMNITVKEAPKSRGAEAKRVIKKELMQMLDKKV